SRRMLIEIIKYGHVQRNSWWTRLLGHAYPCYLVLCMVRLVALGLVLNSTPTSNLRDAYFRFDLTCDLFVNKLVLLDKYLALTGVTMPLILLFTDYKVHFADNRGLLSYALAYDLGVTNLAQLRIAKPLTLNIACQLWRGN